MSLVALRPKRLDTPNGRYYQTEFGTFPSVTTVLSATKSAQDAATLENWKMNKFDAEGITRRACERGTYLHNRIERTLNGLPPEEYSKKEKELGVPHFRKSVSPFVSRLHDPRYIEACVYDPSNKYAGTLDILECNLFGEYEVWDWKTSDRPKSDHFIDDYKCQIASYAKAAPKCLPNVGRIVRARIVIAIPTGPAQEFVLKGSDLDYYYRFFLRRLAKFRALGHEYSTTPVTKPARRRS